MNKNLWSAAAVLGALLQSNAATAQNGWSHGITNGRDAVYAATINDSGAVLGQYCFFEDESCYWILANNIGCEEGEIYPALTSSEITSSSIEMVCGGKLSEGKTRYFLKPFDTIEKISQGSKYIGIAIAMDDGQFRVNRFDLRGATAAMKRATELFHKTPRRSSTKDRTL
ncbi:hypothetical protein ACFJGX_11160 [Hydrogenophaga sp. UC242_50]|uniref:hypothetical protein n=1 Tax=unclassified Hydrogenophaga TaxID=2610897 RepID=UPI0036D35665